MKIKEDLIAEFKSWKLFELIIFWSAITTILLISIFNKESAISIIYATCGIIYTLIAGKGRISCYLFGIIATSCYCYLAFNNNLWANFALNLCYYLPMQIIGIFAWKKHLKQNSHEIIKEKCSRKERVILLWTTVKIYVVVIAGLKLLHDTAPYLDCLTTVLSVLGMYMTVKRKMEQWIIWTIVNFLAILMWLKVSVLNSNTYSTLVVWVIYFIIGIYFYIKWKKEIDTTVTE